MTGVVSGSFNALLSVSSHVLCAMWIMHRTLIERVLSAVMTITFGQKKTCTQGSNKATSKDFPSPFGVVFMVF